RRRHTRWSVTGVQTCALPILLALTLFGAELTIIAFIGIILLIGIVKKNGIMLVDFALAAQRDGRSAEEAIRAACLERFRPILMKIGRASCRERGKVWGVAGS